VVKLDVTDPGPVTIGTPLDVNGTVAATGSGSGSASLTVERTRDNDTTARTLTIYVEASDGYAAFGTASQSAARRTLIDQLYDKGIIDAATHQRRLTNPTGG
jgi:hypothetical protein